jgi:AraC family transcriptional regulator
VPVRQLLGRQFAASIVEYQRALCQNWHAHDQPILTLMLAGHVEEAISRETRGVVPLDVGFKPAGIRHADQFGAHGVRELRIALEPVLLAAVEQAGRRSLEWSWTTGSQAVTPLMRVAVRLCGNDASEDDVGDDLQEALAALGGSQPREQVHHAPSAWLCRVREQIDDCHGSGLRLSDLALSADVHPVYLARRFRASYGCSVGEYVRWRRVIAAIGLFRNHRAAIAEVATRVGCSDQPHLTRVVRRATGVTPAVLRRLMTLLSTEVQNVQDDTGTLPLPSTE